MLEVAFLAASLQKLRNTRTHKISEKRVDGPGSNNKGPGKLLIPRPWVRIHVYIIWCIHLQLP